MALFMFGSKRHRAPKSSDNHGMTVAPPEPDIGPVEPTDPVEPETEPDVPTRR